MSDATTSRGAVERLIERMRVAYGGALSRDCTVAFRALLARVDALEARADIDQSAYEELLRAMPDDPPLPPDPNDEYIERIKELEAELDTARSDARKAMADAYRMGQQDERAKALRKAADKLRIHAEIFSECGEIVAARHWLNASNTVLALCALDDKEAD